MPTKDELEDEIERLETENSILRQQLQDFQERFAQTFKDTQNSLAVASQQIAELNAEGDE